MAGRFRMPATKNSSKEGYEDAIRLLNSTQSGHRVLEERRRQGQKLGSSALTQMRQWLGCLGYNSGDLNRMNILHVAGTKGKGTTCAFTQSILQQFHDTLHFPRKIGLYTSPHLVTVRERIKINSTPISEDLFAKYFFEVWNALDAAPSKSSLKANQDNSTRPSYFRLLTLVSFHVFMQENIDVAIYEVGVGGELDSTNIIDEPVAVGITTLGIDHVQTLGSTIQEIAWHKAGIMKKACPVFTIEQIPEAMGVLETRASEKGARLTTVSSSLIPHKINIRPDEEFQRRNASIAVSLARTVVERLGRSADWHDGQLPTQVVKGLENTICRGRCETVERGIVRWHFDGAHTEQSLEVACRWFCSVSQPSTSDKVLIFNQQSTRDTQLLLRTVHRKLCKDGLIKFRYVIFCTNITFKGRSWNTEFANYNANPSDLKSLKAQRQMAKTWRQLDPIARVVVLPTIEDAALFARDVDGGVTELDILATGSFYLIGGLIYLLDQTAD